ncbi:MAG: hypothetical protein R3A52_26650 [Polyangiales bacterium]
MNAPRNRSSSSSACAQTAVDPITEARAKAFTTDDAAAAFEHFRPQAEKVSTEDLAVFNGQPRVMLTNVNAAIALVEPHFGLVAEQLRSPRFVDVIELPSLVLALGFAARHVPGRALSTGEIDAMFAEALPLREATLNFLEVAAHPVVNAVPAERVRAIREGKGMLDMASDCVDIPAVFARYESALSGRHPFTEAQLARLSVLGNALYQQLQPTNAIAPAPTRTPESILRDQLAAMVRDRYEHLLLMASVSLGRTQAEALLPSLNSTAAPSPPKASDDKPAAKTDAPVASDKPADKPTASDKPAAKTDAPAASDKPTDKPAAKTEPAASEKPAASDKA